MKFLNQFQKFDMTAFLDGKALRVVGTRPWSDHDSGRHLGPIVDMVIWSDKTPYTRKDPSDTSSNRFEKVAVKVSGPVSVQEDDPVELVKATGTIWGDYRNNLAVKAEGVRVISQSAATTTAPVKGA